MNYESPFMKFLEAIANMLIVSVLWLVFSLPLVTVVASSAAMYHSVRTVIFGRKNGNGIFRDFFDSFKLNLKPGIILSLIVIVALLFVAEGLWTGYQIFRISIWGMLYMILGVIISLSVASIILIIPPVLSRFTAGPVSIIRLSAYFAMKRPLRNIIRILLFAALAFAAQFFPVALFIVPALFADLIRPALEQDFALFIKENDLAEENGEEEVQEEDPGDDSESVVDLEERFRNNSRGGKQ